MERQALFKAQGVGKRYGDFHALRNVDMEIRPGEIVGLIGENGAGKSTLLKIISGVEKATEGEMWMSGEPYRCDNPLAANRSGVGMVFQEQSLIRNLTVAQNIFLGREAMFRSYGVINWRRMNQAARQALSDVGVDSVAPDHVVWDLNFAARQMVEIAKVFNIVSGRKDRNALILLDEPTSILNESESEQLFFQMRRLRDFGNSIVFVSHRLNEVLGVTDRIYIFKDGAGAGVVESASANEHILYEKMIGRVSSGEYYKTDRQVEPSSEVVLEARNLSLTGIFRDVSFKLHKGEVLGLCGVEGSGNEALCSVICGDDNPTSGEIVVEGKARASFAHPREALDHGILSVPKERREEGIIGILSIADNMVLSNMNKISRRGVISLRTRKRLVDEWIETLGVKCGGGGDRAMRLSGGHAQKVVFARAILSAAKILILNHPTRGVDVGSKEEIYILIREVAARGGAVLLMGDTLDEYIGLSSRMLIMRDGLVTAEFQCPANDKPAQLDIIEHMM